METISKILNTTVFSIGDGPGVTVLQIAIALLTLLIGFWLARWAERTLSRQLEGRKVDASVVQPIRRLFYVLVNYRRRRHWCRLRCKKHHQ
jgi:small-conductance mechanosensitive channel